jgi:putative MATE family efflux protein
MVRLSIPGMVGMLVSSLYNIIGTFWVSGLSEGTHAIAALTVLFPLQMIAGALGMGLTAGVISLVSRRFGEARIEDVHQAAGNALVLALGLGLSMALVLLPLARPAVLLFGATAEILGPSVTYLEIVALGFPFLLFSMVASGLYRGSGNTLVPMLLLVCGAVLNAALDPFLIYGWGPFPRLGIAGAALATVISQGVGALCSVWYLWSRHSGYSLRPVHFRLRGRVLADIAQVGAPASAESVLRSLVASVSNWLLGQFGPAAIAAQGLSMRVFMLMISCLGGGVNQALVPTVGYCFGARDYRRLWCAYRIAALWTGIGGLILGLLIGVYAARILAPFIREPELARLGPMALRWRVCTFFLVEPQMMAVFMFQGMGKGGQAMVLTLVRNVVLVVPALFVLGWAFGVAGVFAAQAVADVLALFLAAALVVRAYRRYPPGVGSAAPGSVPA